MRVNTMYDYEIERCNIKYERFKAAGGDMDYQLLTRSFSGRMTKGRWKILNRISRRNTYSLDRCHHEHDCCGCHHYTHTSFTYSKNQVTVTIALSFNY